MSGLKRLVPALVATAVVVLLGGCTIGGPEISSDARCDGPAFTSDSMPAAAPQTLILVELSRNDESARKAVIAAIDPIVSRAVEEGGVIRLLVSGGEGEPMSESNCLDGSSAIMVDRNNDETERRARDTAVAAIEGDVSGLLEEIEIAPRGDLSNLLAAIPDELRSLSGAEGTSKGAPVSVVVVSDLTSPAPTGNCLNLDGVSASQPVADAIVARCLETNQFRRLPAGVGLRFVRPQLTPGNDAGARMSGFLRASLCAQLTDEESGCAAAPARRG